MDYGSLMCWATNAIGRMDEPCIFHLIPAGKPDPVHNCTVVNQTYSTLHVVCLRGFDGGLPQGFTMEVRESNTQYMVANTTNTRSPAFTVTGLQAGKRYSIGNFQSFRQFRPYLIDIRLFWFFVIFGLCSFCLYCLCCPFLTPYFADF